MTPIADLRKSYERAALSEAESLADPLQQFELWLKQAIDAQTPEPTAMTLSTANAAGRPSSRIVLLKGCDEQGLVWYTNYMSRKGQELLVNPFAALQFHWVELERVVRLEGRVEKISSAESNTYFASRPLSSRIGAWASPQSEVIASREWLTHNEARLTEQLQSDPPRPEHWGGYRLKPDVWEFWQGRPSRLHDRLRYCWQAEPQNWLRERLAP